MLDRERVSQDCVLQEWKMEFGFGEVPVAGDIQDKVHEVADPSKGYMYRHSNNSNEVPPNSIQSGHSSQISQ